MQVHESNLELGVSFEVAGSKCEQRHGLTLRCNPGTLGAVGRTKDPSILIHITNDIYNYNPYKIFHKCSELERQIDYSQAPFRKKDQILSRERAFANASYHQR